MKPLLLVLVITLLSTVVYAQGMPGGGKHSKGQDHQNKGEPKKKADDSAYNSALHSLPDRKFDPWQGTR